MVIAHSGKAGQWAGTSWVLHEDTLTDALEPETTPKHRKLGKAEVEWWVAALEKLHGKGENTSG